MLDTLAPHIWDDAATWAAAMAGEWGSYTVYSTDADIGRSLSRMFDSDFEVAEFEYDVKHRIDRKEDRKAAFPRRQELGGNMLGEI